MPDIQPKSPSMPPVPGCIILAGGLSTRVRNVLGEIPKPMAPAKGRPFLNWVLTFLATRGVSQAVVSVGYKGVSIVEYIRDMAPIAGLNVRTVSESSQLGTGGALVHAVERIELAQSHWIICNGDSLILTSLVPLIQAMRDQSLDGALIGIHVPDRSRFGVLSHDSDFILTGFSTGASGAGLINAGMYSIRDTVIRNFRPERPLSLENDVLPDLLRAQKRMRVVPVSAPFIDIGTPESLSNVDSFIDANIDLIANPSLDPHFAAAPISNLS